MVRRKARENAFITLFAATFGTDAAEQMDYARAEDEAIAVDAFGEGLVRLYQNNAEAVDGEINARLKGWTAQRIPRVSLALLRLAVAEMMYSPEDVDSIVINEAVELSKRYGGEGDYQFVNGLLGSFSRDIHGSGGDAVSAAAGGEGVPDNG